MKTSTSARAQADRRRVKIPKNDVILWRPRIVLTPTLDAATARRRRVTLESLAAAAEPAAGLPSAQSVLAALADAQASLARAADARARAAEAESARERVVAAMTAYRLEASLDQTLAGTYQRVTELMEERGLA